MERYQGRIDPARLVFIDETWAKTNMTRNHGWHRRGVPLHAKVPHRSLASSMIFASNIACHPELPPFDICFSGDLQAARLT